ncbi:MAG TPA: hypothetical protein VMZ91_13095 [Candidatus Paceibacterota bacterium]|nr:hypothetical protein [Candidatus Paceibacterota bacterium]
MRKLLIILLMLFLSFSAFSQEVEPTQEQPILNVFTIGGIAFSSVGIYNIWDWNFNNAKNTTCSEYICGWIAIGIGTTLFMFDGMIRYNMRS